jgi:hypothetical protein
MSSHFLERFRNRIQKLAKDGKLVINGNMKIVSELKENQQHKYFESSPKVTSTPIIFGSLSPVRMCRNHSNIPRFNTPSRLTTFLVNYKRPERRGTSNFRSSVKKTFKVLPTLNHHHIIQKARFESPEFHRIE